MTRPSLRLTRPAAVRLLVVGLVLLAVEAWFPFRPELPAWRPSAPERSADVVAFGGDGDVLASPAGMDWVAEAAGTDRFEVRLEARSLDPGQAGPARLLTVAQDHFQADLLVGQDRSDLVVRVRRPGSDPSGDPPFRVVGVLADDAWHALSVSLEGGRLDVAVDGAARVGEQLAPGALAGWDPAQRVALGDDLAGERSWRGELRRAEVRGGDGPTIDLLAPGELESTGGWHLRSRVRQALGSGTGDPVLLSLLRIAVFVPVGAALRRLLRRAGPAALVVGVLAVVLTVGKAFVAGRHPSVADTVLSGLGGLAGIAIVERAIRRRHGEHFPPPPADGPGAGPDGAAPLGPSNGPRAAAAERPGRPPGERAGAPPAERTPIGNRSTPTTVEANADPRMGERSPMRSDPLDRVRHT